MTIKKTKKEENIAKEENPRKYFYAIGRRKTSVSKVRLYPSEGKHNSFKVNEKKLEEYFQINRLIDLVKSPLLLLGESKFEVLVSVSGGGVNAQAEATRMGISRAIVIFNSDFKKSLKDGGFLTRDSRVVERKKPGLKKARKAPQWAKR